MATAAFISSGQFRKGREVGEDTFCKCLRGGIKPETPALKTEASEHGAAILSFATSYEMYLRTDCPISAEQLLRKSVPIK